MSKREQYEQKTEELLLPIIENHGFEYMRREKLNERVVYTPVKPVAVKTVSTDTAA